MVFVGTIKNVDNNFFKENPVGLNPSKTNKFINNILKWYYAQGGNDYVVSTFHTPSVERCYFSKSYLIKFDNPINVVITNDLDLLHYLKCEHINEVQFSDNEGIEVSGLLPLTEGYSNNMSVLENKQLALYDYIIKFIRENNIEDISVKIKSEHYSLGYGN